MPGHYPFLVIHDIDSPGLAVAARLVQAGLRAGEAVIYLSFSRPYDTIRRQIGRVMADPDLLRNLWILDCYSLVYMPEVVKPWDDHVRFADPRDPSDVYAQYMTALKACRATCDLVRSVDQTLSDFIKIADADLVMHYLRRVVVLEETRHVRSLYLFWDEAIQGTIDQKYLRLVLQYHPGDEKDGADDRRDRHLHDGWAGVPRFGRAAVGRRSQIR